MTMNLETIERQTADHPQIAIIWLHGLGADGNDFVPLVDELDLTGLPGIRFIFPHAPVMPVTINNGYKMRAWYDILGTELVATNAESRREDERTMRESQALVEALIAKEKARGIASDHIVLAGFSQGCAMTLMTGLRHPEKLGGLLCLSGYLPLQNATVAERHAENQGTPIFLVHGAQDGVIPIARARQSHQALVEMGYSVEWHEYFMQHSLCQQEVDDIGRWLKRLFVKKTA
ncbi:MAG TPA: alpha/beta hydrolase [Burkholderiaceae bacterium]